MTEIVITTAAALIGGVVRQIGDRVSVPEHTALAFVRAGRARLVSEEAQAAPVVTAEATPPKTPPHPKKR